MGLTAVRYESNGPIVADIFRCPEADESGSASAAPHHNVQLPQAD